MEKVQNFLDKSKARLQANLKVQYATSLKTPGFAKLVRDLKIKESLGMKYTSKLEHTVNDLNNCKGCRSISACSNAIVGYVFYPEVKENELLFSYIPCRHQKKIIEAKLKEEKEIDELPTEIKNAAMKDIDVTDKKRIHVIKWLKSFLDNYGKEEKTKGLYLHGSFGSGKTYLIAAALNELSKKDINVVIIYFANFLRSLKEAMESYSFADKMDEVMNAEILVIDDIGAESLSAWSRDEILGTILQHRMDNGLTTFLTSNLNIEELETHLTFTKEKCEKVKARRIIERIKFLTEDLELVSVNRRS